MARGRRVPNLRGMESQTEETSATLVPSRHLDEPVREVDLAHATKEAWAALKDIESGGNTARTLVKRPELRVVLMVLEKGAVIPEHTAEGDLTLHVLEGRVAVQVDGEHRRLHAGHLLAIEKLRPHAVEAFENSEVLLTLSWPP